MTQKLNGKSLGLSLAILSAIVMLLTWIAGLLNIYDGFVNSMISMHAFFSLGFLGLITGILEAVVWSFIAGWLIAYFYNKF